MEYENENYSILYLMTNKVLPMLYQFSIPVVYEPVFNGSDINGEEESSTNKHIFFKTDMKLYLPNDIGFPIKIKDPEIIKWKEICKIVKKLE